MNSFNRIYILDLHGSTKRKEKAEDGSKDENVFDIQQGVSINIFIKNKSIKNQELLKYDLYGAREHKYKFLDENSISSINWKNILEFDDQLSFKPYVKSSLNDENSFKIDGLFKIMLPGLQLREMYYVFNLILML